MSAAAHAALDGLLAVLGLDGATLAGLLRKVVVNSGHCRVSRDPGSGRRLENF